MATAGAAAGSRVAGGRRRRAFGWSLLELMVVLVIIGLIAGLVGPRILGFIERGETSAAQLQIDKLQQALLTYRLDVGGFPTTAQGLAALATAPAETAERWRGPYLDEAVPTDPWGNPYRYERRSDVPRGYLLYSLGADGAPGGENAAADIGLLQEAAE